MLWCETTYSDVFAAWVHLKAIRVFVESVLRYGIPVNFQAVLLKVSADHQHAYSRSDRCVCEQPRKGYRTKLRQMLGDMYSFLAGQDMGDSAADTGGPDFSGVGSEFYPYVYLPFDLEQQ